MKERFILIFGAAIAVICILFMIIGLMSVMNGCTYSVVMSHASGGSTDDITETQSPTNTVSPDIQLPLVGK